MSLEIIGMFAGLTGGTEDAIAQIDISQDGVLRNIEWDARVGLDATLEFFDVELSFVAVNTATRNDVRSRISSISSLAIVLSSVGINSVSVQKWVGPFELMLFSGERIYMHAVSTAGVVGGVRANLHFDGAASIVRRTSRR